MGRIVVGLAAATLLGGVSVLAGAVSKSESVSRPDAAPVESIRTVEMAAQVNAQLGLRKSEVVRLDTAGMTPGLPIQTAIAMRDRLYSMNLEVHSARSADYKVYVGEGDVLTEVEPGPVNTYRGTLAEAPGSVIMAGLMDDGLYGTVLFEDGTVFWFESLSDRLGAEFDGLHVVYDGADVIPSEGTCGTDHGLLATQHEHIQVDEGPRTGEASGGGPQVAQLAVDADQRFRQRWGTGTEARVNLVINTMNNQYLRDVEIIHQIVALIIRQTDPATYTSNDPGVLLGQFRTQWIGNHTDIQRDVAHLFTGRNLTGSVIGIAWLGVICDSVFNGLGFGLVQSDCCGSLACATDLSAHELGHNWQAEHCGCSGWTMNSGLQCANRFNPTQTIPEMLSYIASRPCLSDLSPVNNNCDDPISIGNGGFAYTTIGSTTDGGTSDCGLVSKDIWFNYTASCDGTATASLCNSDFNTRIAVYAVGDCDGTEIACDDDGCGLQSVVSWTATEGTTYLIRVGGRTAEGSGTLVTTCESGPACPIDIDGSGVTDFGDILAILAAWGNAGGPEDLDNSGTVDFGDILIVLGDWGNTCP